MSTLLACISLGSANALNAITALGCVSILTSYVITIGCTILRRIQGPPLPARRWSLGRYGLLINVTAMLFLTPVWVFMFWPLVIPVTTYNMNWSSALFVGLLLLASAYYLIKGRRLYKGPVAFVKRVD